ncbi:hypothetical protein [Hyphomicrobium sp. CS1GBMeth3]|uniref:hypothetical protein n=1 Tax=Hyphomicrobium sp. CS1GBMeth3 TaxID=1892845 RepID=UPI00092FE082|nr:hypothetical protein [Hyphomicrobium sp. CS1GBMeth3]
MKLAAQLLAEVKSDTMAPRQAQPDTRSGHRIDTFASKYKGMNRAASHCLEGGGSSARRDE